MLEKVKNFIQEHSLLDKNPTIICAVSGGVDSVCLLHILHKLGYSLVLAHVNHHKREQSLLEQKEMEKLAKELNIPFELLDYFDSGTDNFQHNAHHARYTFFKDLAQKYYTDTIATAHHLDDQAETILMRIVSGSNLYGYAGISIVQQESDYRLIRPLLCASKEELYAYAKQQGYPFFEDASNASDDYLRNRIRHNILPQLKKESPILLEKIQEFSMQAKETFEFIRKQSIKYLDKFNNNIEVSSFLLLDSALKKDIICLLFERFHLEKNYDLIHRCVELIEQNKNRKLNLKQNYIFLVEYGCARIEEQECTSSYTASLSMENEVIILNQYRFYFSKKIPQNNAKYLKLCYNDLKLPFLIRNRKEGDFIKMSYGMKKVARVFIDKKVPPQKRDLIPLVFDSEENLLWIYDFAKSQSVLNQKECSDIYLVCEEV